MPELQGKVALVTGAGRGLGEGVAEALAARGARVVLVARDADAVGRVAAGIRAAGGAAEAVGCDVADYGAVAALVARVGRLDILVNNAGVIEPIAAIVESDPAEWARNIGINLVGAYNAVRAALPGMLVAGGGTVVNVSSGAAHRPLEGWSAYCAGKAGLWMFSRALALETEGRGIRVFGFSPGTIDTEMQVKIRASGVNPISQIPRGNLSPVAHAVAGLLYLCTSAADDLHGTDVSMRDEPFRARLGL
jgi:NAD(P)-dependent dehydrogenase (short-subunit alcohol dehydrogenase family)